MAKTTNVRVPARHVAGAAALVSCAASLACVVAAALAPAAGAGAEPTFTIRSTLGGKAVLPHRVAWLAVPALPSSRVRSVEFSIDGRVRWSERNPPYTYGNDGNFLVTSWLSPGMHRFTVEALSADGRRATVTTKARVGTPPPPPTDLAGTWERVLSKAEVEGAIDSAPGRWRLTIEKAGWRFRDPGTHGALVDVAYLGGGVVEARGGVYTRLPGPGLEGNIWCDSSYEPVRYRWSREGDTLTLALAGPRRCDGQSQVWAGSWTRA
jgi:hypothetical protein